MKRDAIARRAALQSAPLRTAATAAAVLSLVLWFVAESAFPAGAWIDAPAHATLATAVAALVVLAACLSGVDGLALCALAGGALVMQRLDAGMASRALAAISMATLGFALWERWASTPGRGAALTLAGTLALIPFGLWLALHIDPAVHAAALGALLMGCVLYAFMRRRGASRRGLRGAAASELPAPMAAVNLLQAVFGFGLLARVL